MARLSFPLGFAVKDNAGAANTGAAIDERMVFASESDRTAYTSNFLYRGLLTYTTATPYHASGVTSNSGFYTRYYNGSVYSWQGLDADTIDDKHANGTMDSGSNSTADPNLVPAEQLNIVNHINYLYTLTSSLSTSRTWKAPVANFAALPSVGNITGDSRITLDTSYIYTWNGTAWIQTSGSLPMLSSTTDGVVSMVWYDTLDYFVSNEPDYLNQNAFSKISGITSTNNLIGTCTPTATDDTFILKEGSNITLNVDSSTRTITVNSTATGGTTYAAGNGIIITSNEINVGGTIDGMINWTGIGYDYWFEPNGVYLSSYIGPAENNQSVGFATDAANMQAGIAISPIAGTSSERDCSISIIGTLDSTTARVLVASGTAMTDFKGIVYDKDYSSRNTTNARWLPDKGYVDTAIADATGGGIIDLTQTLLPAIHYYRQVLNVNTNGDIRTRYTTTGRYTERYNSGWVIVEELIWDI